MEGGDRGAGGGNNNKQALCLSLGKQRQAGSELLKTGLVLDKGPDPQVGNELQVLSSAQDLSPSSSRTGVSNPQPMGQIRL